MTKKYKYDLNTIYAKVNEIVKEIQKEGTSEIQKNFLIGDLLEVTEELVQNNCKKFIAKYSIKDISQEELYSVAITLPLLDALDWFSFEKGNNFMATWNGFMKKRFLNELNAISNDKNKWFRNNISSADKELSEDGTTIVDIVGEEDFTEELCEEMELMNLVKEFEDVDKHGAVIKCLLIDSQEHRTEAIKKALGVETYGSKERKQVQRAKERFIKYLVHNNYDVSKYL